MSFQTLAFFCLALSVIADDHDHGDHDHEAHGNVPAPGRIPISLECALKASGSAEDDIAIGIVEFSDMGNFLFVDAEVKTDPSSLADGLHGFHVHEDPVSDDNDCMSTGSHFNPEGTDHGAPDADEHHMGDFGNVEAFSGMIKFHAHFDAGQFDVNELIGKAVVLHEGEDDLGQGGEEDSLTTGHAGGRLACCTLKQKPIILECGLKTDKAAEFIGMVEFSDMGDSQSVNAEVKMESLDDGLHGFHVHEAPVSNNDCKSTGSHFNPEEKDHGAPDDDEHHQGDFGNVEAKDGEIMAHMTFEAGQFDVNELIGKAVVLHEGEDDLGQGGEDDSLTTGHAGGRLACCTLQLQKKRPQGQANMNMGADKGMPAKKGGRPNKKMNRMRRNL